MGREETGISAKDQHVQVILSDLVQLELTTQVLRKVQSRVLRRAGEADCGQFYSKGKRYLTDLQAGKQHDQTF